jgi:hypothetical protein
MTPDAPSVSSTICEEDLPAAQNQSSGDVVLL